MQPSSVQHVQSMAAAIAELTRQNQELTRELNSSRQHRERDTEGHTQSQEDRRNAEPESQSRGTTSRRVPHLEKEMDQMRKVVDEMRENIRRANPVEDLVYRTDSLSLHSSTVTFSLQSSRCPPWIHTMECVTLLTTLQLSKLQCTFKGFQTR